MHFTPAIAAAILAATADAIAQSSAAPNATWITQTVTEYITDCPTPTSFVHNKETYTVTTSTKVTLPCPHTCTITWNPAKPSVIPVGVAPPPKWNGTAPYTNGTAGCPPGKPCPAPVPAPTTGSNVPGAPGSGSGTKPGSNAGSNSGSNSPAGSKTPATAVNSGNVKTVGTAAVLAGLVGVAALAL